MANFARSPIHWRSEPKILGLLCVILCGLAFGVIPGWASQVSRPSIEAQITLPVTLPPADRMPVLSAPAPDESRWQRVRVRSGQTLGSIFADLGLGAGDMQRVIDANNTGRRLQSLRPGEELLFAIPAAGRLEAMRFASGDESETQISLDGRTISVKTTARPYERQTEIANGVIEDSLFGAAEHAGLDDAMTMKLAEVLGYDIDFAQDLREGDRFAVIYDTLYRDGERVGNGDILAASFINNGHRYTALRLVAADGSVSYFDAEGHPLKKAFLRTPVEFSKISSRFSVGRMHPILGTMRAHRGVDYAAPQGTAVKAAGSGRVAFRGWQSGYGNCIILEHSGGVSTLYGHLSAFASNLRQGGKVGQGQTIGLVGMTGLATGPHLHFEFRINGVHRDPLTVVLPKADPLTGTALADFRARAQPMLERLGGLEERALAAR